MAGWSAHQMSPSGRLTKGHNRSLSSIVLRSASPGAPQAPPRTASSSESPTTAAEFALLNRSTPPSKRHFAPQSIDDANDLSTIPDPRSRAISPQSGDTMTNPHHPDLDNEVAALSTKLINAINHQTTLDDNLSATKLELEASLERIRQLEQVVEEQREMLAGDVWVRRKTVETEKTQLLARIADEKRARHEVELQKKKIEQELENLTAALFEEANKMVISAKEEARIEQEALQRKNDQLKAQIADTEGLLRSQQEQLAELKHVMEQMSAEKDDQSLPTVPSSPGFSKFDTAEEYQRRPSDGIPQQHGGPPEPISPSYPTSFTHLLQPILRTDLAAYDDFKDLVRTSKRLSGQRHSASSSTGLASLGLGLGSVASQVTVSNSSTSSLSTAGTPPATSPQTPVTPASSTSAGSVTVPVALPSLKETKFYKRTLAEDIEPTLRLDIAPGLSWLARRSVLTAMTDGTLVVEPVPATTTGRFGRIIKPELYPCSLCGETRKDDEYLRAHQFRIGESGSAQTGYPLCNYCLVRVRSTCDFLGFLRIVKDGHWRAEDEDAEKAAWTESVRLREQMFWSRIGGGVLPTSAHQLHPSNSSLAPSIQGEKSPRPSQELPDATSAEPIEDIPKPSPEGAEKVDAPLPNDGAPKTTEEGAEPAQPSPDTSELISASTTPTPLSTDATQEKEEYNVAQRLSLTIPAGSAHVV